MDVYKNTEIECEDGTRKRYRKVSFLKNEKYLDCRKIPKGRFFYDLGRMWKEDEVIFETAAGPVLCDMRKNPENGKFLFILKNRKGDASSDKRVIH